MDPIKPPLSQLLLIDRQHRMASNPFFLVSLLLPFAMLATATVGDWNIMNQPRLGYPVKGTLKNYCESWKFNVELNNIRTFSVVPDECVAYIGKYMTTSQYKIDVQRATEEVMLFLSLEFFLSGDDKDAWIFDVDSTLLSVVPYYMNHSFGGETIDKSDLNRWKSQGKAPAVESMLTLYDIIRERGLKVFLISSREESLRNATANNLVDVGYHGWTRLILRPTNGTGFETFQKYKEDARIGLLEEGYHLWGIVADQWSSLVGQCGPRRVFKLPNPMYYEY